MKITLFCSTKEESLCIQYLFKQQSIVAEDSQWSPSVVTGNVKLLSTADLHGKHMTLGDKYHSSYI